MQVTDSWVTSPTPEEKVEASWVQKLSKAKNLPPTLTTATSWPFKRNARTSSGSKSPTCPTVKYSTSSTPGQNRQSCGVGWNDRSGPRVHLTATHPAFLVLF